MAKYDEFWYSYGKKLNTIDSFGTKASEGIEGLDSMHL